MISSRQQAYLEAIGIEVWSLRNQPAVSETTACSTIDEGPGLRLASGDSGILLICEADIDSANRLANDISRVLISTPVWAWPCDDESAPVSLAEAVDAKLFTTVAIFGHDLAGQFFEDGLPANIHSANLVLLPSMQEIQTQASARKSLWETICRSGLVSRS